MTLPTRVLSHDPHECAPNTILASRRHMVSFFLPRWCLSSRTRLHVLVARPAPRKLDSFQYQDERERTLLKLNEGSERGPQSPVGTHLPLFSKQKHHVTVYRRGIGVGVKGIAGRDAIVHKRRRNSSHKELIAKHFPLFFRVSRRNYCAIVAQ